MGQEHEIELRQHHDREVGFYHVVPTTPAVGGEILDEAAKRTGGVIRVFALDDAWDLTKDQWLVYRSAEEPSGLAMTLWMDDSSVFENHQLERGALGKVHRVHLRPEGRPGSNNPGISTFYSMLNNFGLITAGMFHISEPVTFDVISGYFTTLDDFDPTSSRVRYRINIWSSKMVDGVPMPGQNTIEGDVFASDNLSGIFDVKELGSSVLPEGLESVSRVWRLSFRLEDPFTLNPGDYFFGHDAAIFDPVGGLLVSPLVLAFPFFAGSVQGGSGGTYGDWVVPLGALDALVDGGGGGGGGCGPIVPEPGTVLLLGLGVAGAIGRACHGMLREKRRERYGHPARGVNVSDVNVGG